LLLLLHEDSNRAPVQHLINTPKHQTNTKQNQQTNTKSKQQEYLTVPCADVVPALWHVLAAHSAAEPQPRVIVFFSTARAAQFHADLMRAAGLHVRFFGFF
jgi:superfamily II DNA/RNA helicase